MRYWLDTEFNGFGGELISMAIVGEDGSEFYETFLTKEPIVDWVAENVIPILNKSPIDINELPNKLFEFFKYSVGTTIIVDWPDDIVYFCKALITGPGQMVNFGNFSFIFNQYIETNKLSKVPHNALEDAKAMREYTLAEEEYINELHKVIDELDKESKNRDVS